MERKARKKRQEENCRGVLRLIKLNCEETAKAIKHIKSYEEYQKILSSLHLCLLILSSFYISGLGYSL